MSKIEWKPGNMLYPLPVVMVSVADEEGKDNIITVAWAGTVCTQSAYGVYFCTTGTIFLLYDKRNRRICD